MKARVGCGFLGVLAIVLGLLLLKSRCREVEIASFSARSLLVFIESEQAIPRDQAAQVVGLMHAKNMRDLGSAVVLFKLLRKSDCVPLTDDVEVRDYIEKMVDKYEGRDSPFLDTL